MGWPLLEPQMALEIVTEPCKRAQMEEQVVDWSSQLVRWTKLGVHHYQLTSCDFAIDGSFFDALTNI